MRNAFIEELIALATVHSHIALVVGDLGFSTIEPFADLFPDRFINAGVAEQNMTGLAAGMASEGYHVFTYSIANFPTFRCAEQIRNDIDYHNLPVTVVSVGGGLAYGALGYSHHAIQDYALMRVFPNMMIASPGDPLEVRACLRYLVEHPQPSYLRLGKSGEPVFHEVVPSLEPGRWLKISPGTSPQTFLSTGTALSLAMSRRSRAEFAGFAVHSLPLWGMKFKQSQVEQSEAWTRIITVEDHLRDAGFGSWCREAIGESSRGPRIESVALSSEVFGKVGSQATLNAIGGLI